SVPAPFRQIARECLRVNPAERCSLDQIRQRLQTPPTSAQTPRIVSREQAQYRDEAEPEPKSKTAILAVVAVLLLLAGFFAVKAKMHNPSSSEAVTQSSESPAAQVAPSASAANPPQG